ncbi:MAG TPA: hypothetical protein VM532_04020 [Burkholderiales bacterium]|jgi:hypothetical protein|nr:hypothetical protein [Burkholderiales bacterium]
MKLRFFYVDGGIHPKLGQVFHWQQKVMGGEDKKRYTQYLCEVLSSVAQGVDDCDRLLDAIDNVESGTQTEIETGGNDVTLTFKASGVQVNINANEDWIGQPEGQFKLNEWKTALKGWRKFLEMPQSLDSILEIDV